MDFKIIIAICLTVILVVIIISDAWVRRAEIKFKYMNEAIKEMSPKDVESKEEDNG